MNFGKGPSGPSGPSGPEKDHLVLINCYYYSFYMKKSELDKYHIPKDIKPQNSIEKPIQNTNNLNCIIYISEENDNKNNNQNNDIFNFSNILDKYKLLENLILTKTNNVLYLVKKYIY